jgi:hypothetical protein
MVMKVADGVLDIHGLAGLLRCGTATSRITQHLRSVALREHSPAQRFSCLRAGYRYPGRSGRPEKSHAGSTAGSRCVPITQPNHLGDKSLVR